MRTIINFKKLLTVLFLMSCVSAFADTLFKSSVTASYYADKYHGRKTSNGEIFNMNALTAAHKTLPFNTIVRVTNLANGKSVQVRINDRGPFVKGREIDVSKAAAQQLDMIKTGTATVKLEILSDSSSGAKKTASKSDSSKKTVTTTTEAIAKAAQNLDPNKTWDIQLGAFTSRGNAEKLAQKLMNAGFENVVYQKTSEWTKVVIRNVATDNVQAILDRLEEKNYTDYFVRERANVKESL